MRIKVIVTAAFGAFGAAMMWLFAATGINAWTVGHQWSDSVNLILSAFCGGNAGFVLTRGKSSALRVTATVLASLGLTVISFYTSGLGIKEWIAYGPSWHAAVIGGVIFAGSAAFGFWWSSRK